MQLAVARVRGAGCVTWKVKCTSGITAGAAQWFLCSVNLRRQHITDPLARPGLCMKPRPWPSPGGALHSFLDFANNHCKWHGLILVLGKRTWHRGLPLHGRSAACFQLGLCGGDEALHLLLCLSLPAKIPPLSE